MGDIFAFGIPDSTQPKEVIFVLNGKEQEPVEVSKGATLFEALRKCFDNYVKDGSIVTIGTEKGIMEVEINGRAVKKMPSGYRIHHDCKVFLTVYWPGG